MAGKKEAAAGSGSGAGSTAMTVASAGALATEGPDELAVLNGLDLESDGLDEVGGEDFKIALKVWNFKGVDEAGEPVPPNAFFDTVDESVKKELRLVFLTLHKSKEWREYVEGEGKSRVRCRSNDRVMGIMEDGTERPCKDCPDAKWKTVDREGKTKRTRNCGDVYNVVALDLDTQQPATLRFKRTSLKVIQGHLQKHHIGKRLHQGQRLNVPFFQFMVRAWLKMSDDKKYAIPVLEKGPMFDDPATLLRFAGESKFFREHILPLMSKLEAVESTVQTGEEEDPTDFAYGANVEGGGGAGRKYADADVDADLR